jgi:hypothetical protein
MMSVEAITEERSIHVRSTIFGDGYDVDLVSNRE